MPMAKFAIQSLVINEMGYIIRWLLNQAHSPATGWCKPGFLKLFLCGCLYECVCLRVRVPVPEAIINLCNVDPI